LKIANPGIYIYQTMTSQGGALSPKNGEPSGANRNEVKMANGKQMAAGHPEGASGGEHQRL